MSAGLKILRSLRLAVAIRKAYTKHLGQLIQTSISKIQNAFLAKIMRTRARVGGIFRATIFIDLHKLKLGQIKKVEIFGEFTEKTKYGAWGKKILCTQLSSPYGQSMGGVFQANSVYFVTLDIRIG